MATSLNGLSIDMHPIPTLIEKGKLSPSKSRLCGPRRFGLLSFAADHGKTMQTVVDQRHEHHRLLNGSVGIPRYPKVFGGAQMHFMSAFA